MSVSLSELIQNDAALYQEIKDSLRQEIRCAMPGIIQAYNADTQTATVQPAIREKRLGLEYEDLPLLLDVPVFFPGGNNACLAFSVSKGTECLVIFSDTCIDNWLLQGGTQNPVTPRRHDLSDGFALVGFRSLPMAFAPGNSVLSMRVKTGEAWADVFSVSPSGVALVNGEEKQKKARVEGKKLILE